jgi:transcriptional regulator with XRE-family HTH domain
MIMVCIILFLPHQKGIEMIENWRDWLGSLSPQKKRDVEKITGVVPSTLSAWKNGKARPQLEHLYRLINYEPALKEAIEREFPGVFQQPELEETHIQIPKQLYEEALTALAFTAESVCGQAIATKVFESLCAVLDHNDDGLLVLPSLCVDEDGENITKLLTVEGLGTGPWKTPYPARPCCELGRDSLMGMAVMRRRHVIFPHAGFLDHRPFTINLDEIKSAVAIPIWRHGNIAGALLVASVHPNFFNANRRDVCSMYTHAYALSLPDSKFYNPDRIALRIMRESVEMPSEQGDEADGETDCPLRSE